MSKHKVFYRPIHNINIAELITDILTCPWYTSLRKRIRFMQAVPPNMCMTSMLPLNLKPCHKSCQLLGGLRKSYNLKSIQPECVWRKSRSSLDLSGYSRRGHQCNREMAKAKSDYYENMVSNNSSTSQQLWKCINRILHMQPAPSLPAQASIKSVLPLF